MHDVSLVSLRKCATPPLWSCLGSCVVLLVLVHGSSMSCVNRDFEPVGERCAGSLRSRVRLAMAVTPSMDLSLVFG
jgi:hypothetical protein